MYVITKMAMARLLTLAAALVLLVTACSRGSDSSNDDLDAVLAIVPSPAAVGQAQLTLRLSDAAGAPVSGATLEIEGNMSHAGMQPVFVETVEDAPGRYASQGFEFTMAGDWIITITGELADGSDFERTFNLRDVES